MPRATRHSTTVTDVDVTTASQNIAPEDPSVNSVGSPNKRIRKPSRKALESAADAASLEDDGEAHTSKKSLAKGAKRLSKTIELPDDITSGLRGGDVPRLSDPDEQVSLSAVISSVVAGGGRGGVSADDSSNSVPVKGKNHATKTAPVTAVPAIDAEDGDDDDLVGEDDVPVKGKKRATKKAPVAPVAASEAEEGDDDDVPVKGKKRATKTAPVTAVSAVEAEDGDDNDLVGDDIPVKGKKRATKKAPVAPVAASEAEEGDDDDVPVKGKKRITKRASRSMLARADTNVDSPAEELSDLEGYREYLRQRDSVKESKKKAARPRHVPVAAEYEYVPAEPEDIDQLKRSFIDDEAVESNASDSDKGDGSGDDIQAADDEDINDLSDTLTRLFDESDPEIERILRASRREMKSPDWAPITTPRTPQKTRNSQSLDSPGTPSPKKTKSTLAKALITTASSSTPAKRARKRGRTSDIAPVPNKSARTEDADVDEQPDSDELPSIAAIIEDNIVRATQPAIMADSPAAMTPRARRRMEELARMATNARPQVMANGEAVNTLGDATQSSKYVPMPDTVGNRLATEFETLPVCEVDHAFADSKASEYISYVGLPKLKMTDALRGTFGRLLISANFASSVVAGIGFDDPSLAAHLRKLITVVQTAAFGPRSVIRNIARDSLRGYAVGRDIELTNSLVVKYLNVDGRPDACIFMTLAIARESNLQAPMRLPNTELYLKRLTAFPLGYEGERALCAADNLLVRGLTDLKMGEHVTSLNPNIWEGAISFSTRLHSNTPQRETSRAKLPVGIKEPDVTDSAVFPMQWTPQTIGRYWQDFLVHQMRHAAIPCSTAVPIFDATQYFVGDKVNRTFDWSKLGELCPLLGTELRNGDLVAIMHSIYSGKIKGSPSLQYGIYNATLLARP